MHFDSPFIIALILTSIIAVAFIIERGMSLRWLKIVPPAVESAVRNYRSSQDLDRLRGICDHNPSSLSRLLVFAADHADWPRDDTANLLETRARHEVVKLERGLVVLEIIVGVAPLLGLVGTIYGLIILFGGMDKPGTIDSVKFSRGISEALYATLLGLLVAIPALVAWSYFSKKVENLTVEMETLCDEFLRKHYGAVEADATPVKAVPRSYK